MGFHWGGDASNQRLVFSIFLCGCKQPKSIHILKTAAKLGIFYELLLTNGDLFLLSPAKTYQKPFWSEKDNAYKTAYHAKHCTRQNLPKIMLAKKHTAAADKTGNEDEQAEPADRIEIEKQAVGHECSYGSAGSGTVHWYLPLRVDEGTAALDK